MSIEAMKQALEALEDLPPDPKDYIEEAVEILRQAIEQAEKQEPVATKISANGSFLHPAWESVPIGAPLYHPTHAPVHDELAYRQAVSLATWLFKKHFAHEEHYASGRVVWEPCDTTAGVISQIDNMVCGLVQPAATVKESLTVPQAENQKPVAEIREDMKGGGYIEWLDDTYFVPGTKFYTQPQQAEKQKPVAWMYEFGTDHCDAVTPVRWYKNVTALKKPDPNESLVRNVRPLYLKPQREWVGLTDEEVVNLVDDEDWYNYPEGFVKIVEAKLKDKNSK